MPPRTSKSRRCIVAGLLTLAACCAASAEEGSVRYALILETGIRADVGTIGSVPSRMSKTLRSEGLASDADLEGTPFVNGTILYLPSILGRRPQTFPLYVPPTLREQVREQVFVRWIESRWKGFGVARTRIVHEVLSRERYPEVYAQCGDVYEVHLCVERLVGQRPLERPDAGLPSEPPASAPASAERARAPGAQAGARASVRGSAHVRA